MDAERPKERRIRLPSGRSLSLGDLTESSGGPWEARPMGSHYIVQRQRLDGSEQAVTGRSTLDMTMDKADADALVLILNAE